MPAELTMKPDKYFLITKTFEFKRKMVESVHSPNDSSSSTVYYTKQNRT
jgi:hypothetical protein